MNKQEIQIKLLEPYKEIIEGNQIIAEFEGYSVDETHQWFNGLHYYKLTSETAYNELTIDNVRSLTDGWVWNYLSLIEKRYDNDWNKLIQLLYLVHEEAYKLWNLSYTDDRMYIQVDFYQQEVTAIDANTGLYMFEVRKSENMLANLYFTLIDSINWINYKRIHGK
jgi:hypothetical protein